MKKSLSASEKDELLRTLKTRFEKNRHRHEGMDWSLVQATLEAQPDKLWSLQQMESSGGEPDVVAIGEKTDAIVFCDCSAESPKGRRNLCYDRAALDARKEHKPEDSVLDVAMAMGVELLSEAQYRALQALEQVDTKTSSWVLTPPEIRQLGGALFCDRRYNHVFLYHNGAQSYYASRGFRGMLQVF